jgi:hypothetical protein
VRKPRVDDSRPRLDLGGLPAPAAAITTLAGCLSTCFNLLDFFCALPRTSAPVLDGLVDLLSKKAVPKDDKAFLQDRVDLPHALRRNAYERLLRLSRCPNPLISPVQVALPEPWLTSRDGFPDSWRETFGTAP